MSHAADILNHVIAEVESGRRAALCAIVSTRGSTPLPAGTIVCVDESAQVFGTLGGGCVEADIRRRAHEMLSDARSELRSFDLDDDFGFDDGMICGGHMDVAISVLSPTENIEPIRCAVRHIDLGQDATIPITIDRDGRRVVYQILVESLPKLVIAGAGHISRVLATMMTPLGFSIDVVDDRSKYANADRFPPPVRTTVGDIPTTLESWPIDERTYLVIVTRGHKRDEATLRVVVASNAKYIGMIGSRRKINVVYDDLKRVGVSDAQLARVHAPIGLDIQSVTTDEIALSIAAQLVSVRRADRHTAVTGPTVFDGEST